MSEAAEQLILPPLMNDDEVVVVSIALDRFAHAAESLAKTLSPEEFARASRYRYQKDRDAYMASRALLRACLGHYLQVAPQDVCFAYSEEGKPGIDAAHHANAIEFNLSHTDGLIAIAFSRTRRVGIDVEKSRPVLDEVEIADRFFASTEADSLRCLPESERHAAFLRCWTRKEAFAKATGLGLSETLHPHFDEEHSHLSRFSYHSLTLDSDYVGVVAVEGEGSVSTQIFLSPEEILSLASQSAFNS